MANMTGLFRLGRDAELRYTQGGDPILNVALAYEYGRKGQDGRRPTQWLDAVLFGKRAESLAQYLTKGSRIYAGLSDVHIRTYEKKDGTTGFSLSANIQDVEFAGGNAGGDQGRNAQTQSGYTRNAPAQDESGADFDDDIPF